MLTTKEKIGLAVGALVCVGEIVFKIAIKKAGEERMMKHFGVRTADEFFKLARNHYFNRKKDS